MKLNTNREKVVAQSVAGRLHHPVIKAGKILRVGYDGIGRVAPAHGGITYDIEIGDSCMGLAGDHIEPGASTKNPNEEENRAYTHLSCVGNVATVISGAAAGDTGYVTGKHGGIDHVMIWFSQETLNKMVCDDRIQVKAYGQGLALTDYPDVHCMSLDPDLLDAISADMEEKDGKLYVPVVTEIPAHCMGSGLGQGELFGSDYDIMTRDPEAYEQCRMGELRYGDLVYIRDHVADYGADYRKGAGTLGVIIHGDSKLCGHGPGVTVLMTSAGGKIQPKLCRHANIAHYLGIRSCD